jgi:hypothetical protein
MTSLPRFNVRRPACLTSSLSFAAPPPASPPARLPGRAPALAIALAVALGATAGAREARACSKVAPAPHAFDQAEAAVDSTPPSAPSAWLAQVRWPAPEGGASCDGLGFISIGVDPAYDDRTPADAMGYRFEIVDGRPPRGLQLPAGPVRLFGEGGGRAVELYWSADGEGEESVSFRLAVYAVDRAGNESARPTYVEVYSDRTSAGVECCYGGSIVGTPKNDRPSASSAGLVLLGLAGVARAAAARAGRRRALTST